MHRKIKNLKILLFFLKKLIIFRYLSRHRTNFQQIRLER